LIPGKEIKGMDHKETEKLNKEDSFFIFRTRHKYEYRCPDCGLTFWLTD